MSVKVNGSITCYKNDNFWLIWASDGRQTQFCLYKNKTIWIAVSLFWKGKVI